jgi:hypothetical protein
MPENDRSIQRRHSASHTGLERGSITSVKLIMQRAFGLSIPQTLADVCDPARLALIVYEMQVRIVKQIENEQQITRQSGSGS